MSEKDQFKLWVKYEDITMHFNDLLIRLRTQALGGVATIVTAAGFLASRQAADATGNAWDAVALVSALLLVGWLTIWIIDVRYYNRLLRGAVEALVNLEAKTNGQIDFSHTVERVVRKNKEVSVDAIGNRPAWHVHLFYSLVGLVLLIVSGWSMWRAGGAFALDPPEPSGMAPARTTAGTISWNYWDAIAPSTWNGWALAALAFIAALIALRTLRKLAEQVATEKSSVDLMRTEYNATHRPRIRVRSVDLELGGADLSNNQAVSQTRVGFIVVNYGESEAIFVNAQYSVILGNPLPMTPNYQSEFKSKLKGRLLPGESARVVVTGEQYPLLMVLRNDRSLHVVGYVDYKGTTGVTYRTAFGRRFIADDKHFEKLSNSDYEYEE
jgi:hypothetical protein